MVRHFPVLQIPVTRLRELVGWAEFAGLENAGVENADEVARVEIDGLENEWLEIDGPENGRRSKNEGLTLMDWNL